MSITLLILIIALIGLIVMMWPSKHNTDQEHTERQSWLDSIKDDEELP